MLPKIHLNIERWKLNKELNIYVSSMGNFKDINKNQLIPRTNRTGYLVLFYNKKIYYCHRLVMQTFKPQRDSSLTVDHLDHNKKNNVLNNLEWVSLEENRERARQDFLIINDEQEIDGVLKNTVPMQRASKIEKIPKNIPKKKMIYFGAHKVKSCMAAAEIIIKEKEYPHSGIELQRISSEIGQYINTDKICYGYKFERR
jgi:hypothetical protein